MATAINIGIRLAAVYRASVCKGMWGTRSVTTKKADRIKTSFFRSMSAIKNPAIDKIQTADDIA